MDQDFTKEDVIAACLITTQKDQSEEQFKRAERYLIAFQKAPEAWPLSSEILNTEGLQLAVYAQVAIFLKQKLQYDFAQLPQSEYLNITQVILSTFLDILSNKYFLEFLMKHYHPAIVSQLSLSLVLLYMHAFETLGDLIDILGQTLFTVDKKDVIALDIIKVGV